MHAAGWLCGFRELGFPLWASDCSFCHEELLAGESTFLCLEGCVPVRGEGLQDQGLATAAFSLSHQISQLKAKCLNMSK